MVKNKNVNELVTICKHCTMKKNKRIFACKISTVGGYFNQAGENSGQTNTIFFSLSTHVLGWHKEHAHIVIMWYIIQSIIIPIHYISF